MKSLRRTEPEYPEDAYQKPDGRWVIVRRIDSASFRECPATEEEIAKVAPAAETKPEPDKKKKAKS